MPPEMRPRILEVADGRLISPASAQAGLLLVPVFLLMPSDGAFSLVRALVVASMVQVSTVPGRCWIYWASVKA